MEITKAGSNPITTQSTPNLIQRPVQEPVKQDQPQEPGKQETPIQKNDLADVVQKANEVSTTFTTHLQFKMHEETGEFYVKVINDNNNEVIREIPAEKFLDMVAAMEKLMKGIFVDAAK